MNMTRDLLGLELEIEPCGESVQLDLTLGEESVGRRRGGLPGREGHRGGEHSLGQQTGQVSGLQHRLQWRDYRTETRQTDTHVLVAGVVRVDEGRLWESVVIVFIFVLLRLSDLISNLGLGGGLTSAGNVVSVQNSVTFGRVSVSVGSGTWYVQLQGNIAIVVGSLSNVNSSSFSLSSDLT